MSLQIPENPPKLNLPKKILSKNSKVKTEKP